MAICCSSKDGVSASDGCGAGAATATGVVVAVAEDNIEESNGSTLLCFVACPTTIPVEEGGAVVFCI